MATNCVAKLHMAATGQDGAFGSWPIACDIIYRLSQPLLEDTEPGRFFPDMMNDRIELSGEVFYQVTTV
jgi:hypothetical protein